MVCRVLYAEVVGATSSEGFLVFCFLSPAHTASNHTTVQLKPWFHVKIKLF